MLTITEGAKQLLKETLREYTEDPETGIRLSVKQSGQFGILLDNESEGDQVVEYDGAKVLLVSSKLATTLEGARLDIKNTDEGPKLFLSKGNQDETK